MFDPINLSAYANAELDALASGEPRMEQVLFFGRLMDRLRADLDVLANVLAR